MPPVGSRAPDARASSGNAYLAQDMRTPVAPHSREQYQQPAYAAEFPASQTRNPNDTSGGTIPQSRSYHNSSRATSRGVPREQTAFAPQQQRSQHQSAHHAPSVPASTYEGQPMPTAESRASAAHAPSQTSQRTHRSRTSHQVPLTGPPQPTQQASQRTPSHFTVIVEEEEPFSEIGMYPNAKKPTRPRVCHHEEGEADSLCPSEAWTCELMDDGVTLNREHVHTKEACGFVLETE